MKEFLTNTANLKKGLFVLLGVIVVGSIGSAVYFHRQASELRRNPQAAAQKEVKDLVEKVGRLMVLPQGGDVTVATVADPDALKDQPFFARAKQGDKVLIYTDSKKAILYDPVNDKIVEVAPLNIGNQ